jgi:DNA polymerase-4
MADSAINWLFVDLNSYFASIEQELCPELRGQPIAIVPIRVEAQTGCCIAVSYQAKAYGVKTGVRVADANLLCPHIILVEARPRLYVCMAGKFLLDQPRFDHEFLRQSMPRKLGNL